MAYGLALRSGDQVALEAPTARDSEDSPNGLGGGSEIKSTQKVIGAGVIHLGKRRPLPLPSTEGMDPIRRAMVHSEGLAPITRDQVVNALREQSQSVSWKCLEGQTGAATLEMEGTLSADGTWAAMENVAIVGVAKGIPLTADIIRCIQSALPPKVTLTSEEPRFLKDFRENIRFQYYVRSP